MKTPVLRVQVPNSTASCYNFNDAVDTPHACNTRRLMVCMRRTSIGKSNARHQTVPDYGYVYDDVANEYDPFDDDYDDNGGGD